MAHSDPFRDELVRVSADIDRLIAERDLMSRPSQTRHEGHVDQVEELAARLRRIGRGPGRPVHQPLARTATGFVW